MVLLTLLWSGFIPAPLADVEQLLERLRTEDANERHRVVMELVRLGGESVEPCLRALESASSPPAPEVARLVERLGARSWKERNQATEALIRLGRFAIPALEARIASADPEAAWRLRSAIAEIREKAGQDEQLEEVRSAALCDVLGQLADGRAVAPLLRLLSGEAPGKRFLLKLRACQALGLLHGSISPAQAGEAADRVLELLERTSGPLEKSMLLKTLGELGTTAGVRPLAALLLDRSEKNVHLKRSCMSALAAIGQGRGIRAIVESLEADDVYVRQGAVAVLAELAGDAFGFDPRAGTEENRAAVARFQAWGASKYGKDWQE